LKGKKGTEGLNNNPSVPLFKFERSGTGQVSFGVRGVTEFNLICPVPC
jgi:hypothetical protein